MLQLALLNRVPFGKFNGASAFSVATRPELVDRSCWSGNPVTGATIKWNHFLTFRKFLVRRRRTVGGFNLVCLREEIKQRTDTAFWVAVANHASRQVFRAYVVVDMGG
jgi:hypothetical protein